MRATLGVPVVALLLLLNSGVDGQQRGGSSSGNYVWENGGWVWVSGQPSDHSYNQEDVEEGSADYGVDGDGEYGDYYDDYGYDDDNNNYYYSEGSGDDDRDMYNPPDRHGGGGRSHTESVTPYSRYDSANGDNFNGYFAPPDHSHTDDIIFDTPDEHTTHGFVPATPGYGNPTPGVTFPPQTTARPTQGHPHHTQTTSFFAQPGILAAVIGGAVVGLLCAILLVMFIVYRMRKKDEGSYSLDEPRRSPNVHLYSKAPTREFFA